jgi:tryptophan-rich sensory protein
LPAQEPSLARAKTNIRENDQRILDLKDSVIAVSNRFISGQINEQEYKSSHQTFTADLRNSKLKSEFLENQYSKTREEVDILGFPSRHKFMWNFGIGLLVLFVAIDFSMLLKLVDRPNKKHKTNRARTYFVAAGYYMAWVFFPYDDLPLPVYFAVLVLIGLFSGLSAHYLFSKTYKSRGQLLSALSSYINFTLEESEEQDFVKDDKKDWYDKRTVELVDKALGDE